MKKRIIIVSFIIIVIFLMPIPNRLKDGGSIEYRSLLYKVTKIHRLNDKSISGYEDGWKIEILGIRFYNQTHIAIDTEGLKEIQDKITDKVASFKDYDNFASCGIDEDGEFLIVELVDNSKKEQNWFRENIYDSEYIKFRKGGPYYAY